MAELNFPTGNPPSPTTYTEAGITWTWNNTLGVWSTDAPDQVADLSDVHVGSSPPATFGQGSLWWNTDDGRLYIYYEDGNTNQWVDASPDNESLTQTVADGRYLSSISNDTAEGAITFEALTTHEAGVSVTGGANSIAAGLYGPGSNQLGIKATDKAEIYVDNTTGAATAEDSNAQCSVFLQQRTATTVKKRGLDVRVNTASGLGATTELTGVNSRLAALNSGLCNQSNVTTFKAFEAENYQISSSWGRGDAKVTGNYYGFYSDVTGNASITGNAWNFYAAGTAPSYFAAGFTTRLDLSSQENPLAAGAGGQVYVQGQQINICQGGSSLESSCLSLNRTGNINTESRWMSFFPNGSLSGGIRIESSNTTQFWTGPSDYRLKENIVDLPSAVDKIKALRPVDFVFKNAPDESHVGFIAHEVQEVIPLAAHGLKDAVEEYGDLIYEDGSTDSDVSKPESIPFGATFESKGTRILPQSINQDKLIPYLTKALQEALTEIDTLKSRLDALEGA